MRTSAMLILSLSFFCSSAAIAQNDASSEANLDAIVKQVMSQEHVVGASVLVTRGDKILLSQGYGFADLGLNAPANLSTVYHVVGPMLPFTGIAVMQQVERGKLSLDDDISKFIPEFPLQGHHVTVRQLLNHTSGIVDYHYLGDPIEATSRQPKALDEVMALYAGKNWVNEPGKKWDWSAKHWARDQIVWPAGLTALITIGPALYLHKSIDWQLFRTALLLYVIVFFTYGLFQLIRASWKTYQAQENEIKGLRKTIDLRVQDWTEAKQESMRVAERSLQIQRDLVTTTEELIAARTEASNNSQAFHAEYAKNIELKSEMERFKSNRLKEEWLKLEEKFSDVGGGSNLDIEAFWERNEAHGEFHWSLMRGWDAHSKQRFKVVMEEAGNLISESHWFSHHYGDIISEPDAATRWLFAVCKIIDDPMKSTSRAYSREQGHSVGGAVEDLPRKCILACAMLASQEKWPAPRAAEV
ncbi:MAG TPA: serine hydrolase domain-containing protein [Candidatus Angelobacter sp.]|nr:serine hydrolase domain-containing protein [Candidatus Angelobacter sp.]